MTKLWRIKTQCENNKSSHKLNEFTLVANLFTAILCSFDRPRNWSQSRRSNEAIVVKTFVIQKPAWIFDLRLMTHSSVCFVLQSLKVNEKKMENNSTVNEWSYNHTFESNNSNYQSTFIFPCVRACSTMKQGAEYYPRL